MQITDIPSSVLLANGQRVVWFEIVTIEELRRFASVGKTAGRDLADFQRWRLGRSGSRHRSLYRKLGVRLAPNDSAIAAVCRAADRLGVPRVDL